MASFFELTGSEHSKKFLVNLEEITFIQVSEKNKGKTTIIHFTSSTFGADRSIGVMEDYDTVKGFVVKAGLLVEDGK
ncbi:MAG: hypothetical protein ABJA32_08990 [Ginsengibacter sp.]